MQIPYNFHPREYQLSFFQYMDMGGPNDKRSVLVWHRRAGKDLCALNYMIKQMYLNVGNYLYLLPKQTQARKVIWQGKTNTGRSYLDYIPTPLVKKKKIDEMQVELTNDSLFQLAGSDNYDSLVGTNYKGIVCSEYALQDSAAWDYLSPILVGNNGWAIFCYTPRGKNHGYNLFNNASRHKNWFSKLLTIDDTFDEYGNPLVTQEQINELRKMGTDEAKIQSEYYCSFEGSTEGSYYGELITEARKDGRISKNIHYDPRYTVITSWDLGRNDTTAIWFIQLIGTEIRFIDYYENKNQSIDFYLNQLENFRMKKSYKYENHLMPWDGNSKTIHTNLSVKEIAAKKGYDVTIVERISRKTIGINYARTLFPRFYFDSIKCSEGIKALDSYSKEYDSKNQTYKDSPKHDWSSNCADALRTFAEAESSNKVTFKGHITQKMVDKSWRRLGPPIIGE
jgi:phage terminase large subunit